MQLQLVLVFTILAAMVCAEKTTCDSPGDSACGGGAPTTEAPTTEEPTTEEPTTEVPTTEPPLTVPVQLSRISEYPIPAYAAIEYFSICLEGNSLLLGNTEANTLEKWELSPAADGVTRSLLVWSMSLPEGISADCDKHENGDRIGLFERGLTVLVDGATRQEIRRWTVMDYVTGITSTDVAYQDGDKINLGSIEDHTQVVTLLSGGDLYSLCEEGRSGRIAVTDWDRDKLFIFSREKQLLHEVPLEYPAAGWVAVVSVSPELLAVLQSDQRTVHLHSWATGYLLQTIDIPLGEWEYVRTMGVADRVLHLRVEKFGEQEKIVSYELS